MVHTLIQDATAIYQKDTGLATFYRYIFKSRRRLWKVIDNDQDHKIIEPTQNVSTYRYLKDCLILLFAISTFFLYEA